MRRRYGYMPVMCGLILIAFGIVTQRRNEVWRSPQTLWIDAAEKSPFKTRPLLNAGMAMRQVGDMVQAQNYFERAVRVPALDFHGQKLRGLAQTDLGYMMIERGQYQEAFDLINSAIEVAPTLESFNAMALLLLIANEPRESLALTDEILRQGGGAWRLRASLWATRGQAFQMLGDCNEAAAAYVTLKSVQPSFQIPNCP